MEDGQQSGRAPASAGWWSPVRTCPGVGFGYWLWGRWHLSIRVANGVLGGCHPHLPTCHHIPVTGLLGVSEAYFSKSQPHPPWALCPSALPLPCVGAAPPPPPPTLVARPSLGGGSRGWTGKEAGHVRWRVASPGGVELSRSGHTTAPGAPPQRPVPTADPELPSSRGPAPGEDQQRRAGACQAAGLPAAGSGPGAGPAGVCLPPQLCPAPLTLRPGGGRAVPLPASARGQGGGATQSLSQSSSHRSTYMRRGAVSQ